MPLVFMIIGYSHLRHSLRIVSDALTLTSNEWKGSESVDNLKGIGFSCFLITDLINFLIKVIAESLVLTDNVLQYHLL